LKLYHDDEVKRSASGGRGGGSRYFVWVSLAKISAPGVLTAGRRHETGQPVAEIWRRGQEFDLLLDEADSKRLRKKVDFAAKLLCKLLILGA